MGMFIWKTEVGGEVFRWRAAEPRPGASMRDLLPKRLKQEWRELAIAIPVTAVAVSPDGSHLATADGMYVGRAAALGYGNQAAQVGWAPRLRRPAPSLLVRTAVAWRSPAPRFRIGATDLVIFDALSGQELFTFRAAAAVESLAFSPDGARLWGVTVKGMLVFWEASPWPGPVTPPAVALRASVVENPERKSSTRP